MNSDSPSDDPLGALLDEAPFLKRLALGLCRSAADADDLVQDTWIEALRRPPGHLGSPRGFLAAVMRSRFADRRRGAGRTARREAAVAREEALPSGEEDLARFESQALLLEAVRGLPADQARVVSLRFYEELSAAQIAKRLGLPASTVRTTLSRALSKLRERMDAESPGGRERWMTALAPLGLPAVPLSSGLAASFAMKKVVVAAALVAGLVLGGRLVAAARRARAGAGCLGCRSGAGRGQFVPPGGGAARGAARGGGDAGTARTRAGARV